MACKIFYAPAFGWLGVAIKAASHAKEINLDAKFRQENDSPTKAAFRGKSRVGYCLNCEKLSAIFRALLRVYAANDCRHVGRVIAGAL
ncbi:MAG: hypothetical protein ONB48_14410 [candidate division KSB1 bacterium]|nr:hypothetical protein [candidate division KSB1 bacterium]MDZ7273570.1 hypothetical protein [candidate division KSB1 bacterium]MDZ7286839.1 hypothetical protein [candidate division KSB1 bacterium]MDZ7299804.1 hypothetical protein [candidate division KSB1 bacterium]MDZ7308645.1 hypothetical protein [candidate division KSB1 bacterium]